MLPRTCKLCRSSMEPEKAVGGTCPVCQTKLGLVEMPPPRRPPAPCTRCSGMRFVRVMPREYSATGGDVMHHVATPMTLTSAPVLVGQFFGGVRVEPGLFTGTGVLETYVCLGCGFVEWYCQDPTSIPIGPEYMSDVVDYTPATPYR